MFHIVQPVFFLAEKLEWEVHLSLFSFSVFMRPWECPEHLAASQVYLFDCVLVQVTHSLVPSLYGECLDCMKMSGIRVLRVNTGGKGALTQGTH